MNTYEKIRAGIYTLSDLAQNASDRRFWIQVQKPGAFAAYRPRRPRGFRSR